MRNSNYWIIHLVLKILFRINHKKIYGIQMKCMNVTLLGHSK